MIQVNSRPTEELRPKRMCRAVLVNVLLRTYATGQSLLDSCRPKKDPEMHKSIVLIVDDERLVAAEVAATLKDADFTVHSVVTPLELRTPSPSLAQVYPP